MYEKLSFKKLPNSQDEISQSEQSLSFGQLRTLVSFLEKEGYEKDSISSLIRSPELYFKDSFNGHISNQHLIGFINILEGSLNVDPDKIINLALILRDFSKNSENKKEFSDIECKSANTAINILSEYIKNYQTDTNINSAGALEALAYLTNWVTKIKVSLVKEGINGVESISEDTLNLMVIKGDEVAKSFNTKLDNVSDRLSDHKYLNMNIKQMDRLYAKIKYIQHMFLEVYKNEDKLVLTDLLEISVDWDEFSELLSTSADFFSNMDNYKNIIEFTDKIKIFISQRNLNSVQVKNMFAVSLKYIDTNNSVEQARLYCENVIQDIRESRDILEKSYEVLSQQTYDQSKNEVLGRIKNDLYPAADLYFIKGVLSCLYILNKVQNGDISLEELSRGLVSGTILTNGLHIERRDVFSPRDTSSVYFDGGTALHYYKSQMPFMLSVAVGIKGGLQNKIYKSN